MDEKEMEAFLVEQQLSRGSFERVFQLLRHAQGDQLPLTEFLSFYSRLDGVGHAMETARLLLQGQHDREELLRMNARSTFEVNALTREIREMRESFMTTTAALSTTAAALSTPVA